MVANPDPGCGLIRSRIVTIDHRIIQIRLSKPIQSPLGKLILMGTGANPICQRKAYV
jgi:hypothetical protein